MNSATTGSRPVRDAARPSGVPSAQELFAHFAAVVDGTARDDDGLLGVAGRLHQNHLDQWAAEDVCRDHVDDDIKVAAAKRVTDVLNGARPKLIGAMDDLFASMLSNAPDAPMHTETPGSVIDRISIAWIRVFHMRRRSAEAGLFSADEVALAERQLDELGQAYEIFVAELQAGDRRSPDWRTIKSYGER